MKATELMIGDWICYNGRTQIPVRVLSFNNQTIKFDNGTPQDWMSAIGNFEPISLTEDILVKNGFVQSGSKFTCGEISVIFTIKGFSFWTKHMISIAADNGSRINNLHRYVHELQHALRLCGIEKEIKL